MPEPPAGPPPRPPRVRTTAAPGARSTEAADPRLEAIRLELSERVTAEVRNFERHLSEVQGSMVTAYEALAQTVAKTNTAIAELSARVAELTTQRTEDAAFIAGQKAVEVARAHDREIETAKAQERAAVVLEMQEQGRREAETTAHARNAKAARDNKILTIMITTLMAVAGSIGVYLITGTGHQTPTSTALAAIVIGVLVLVAIGLATKVKTELAE
ncbi:MAG TPA: hypothetical protein VN837_05600 [Chloroflexota bacterium]|nr:hypothetical protein [Chloroflexota bacterium]